MSKVLRLPRKMTSEAYKVLRLPRKFATHLLRAFQKYCACHTKWRLTSFADTRQCHEVPRLPRKTPFPHPLKRTQKTSFAAFPICRGTPPQNHSMTRRKLKRAFRTRLPPLFTLCTWIINIFLRVFSWSAKFATSKSTFRARHPSIFSTCPKMQHLPRNLHVFTSWRSPDNAIRTKATSPHVESAAPATQNDIGGVQSVAPATQNATHLLKMWQKYCACHTKGFSTRYETRWNVTKCQACHAKWSYATLETSKSDRFCRTSYRHGHTALARRERLRTVADGCGRLQTVAHGCERLRTVADVNATSGEHSSTPTPPEWNRNPCYKFGNRMRKV